jgi:hypothetical protein
MIITSRLVGCDSYCRGALVVQFFVNMEKTTGTVVKKRVVLLLCPCVVL